MACYKRRKKRSRKTKWVIALVCILCVLTLLFVYYFKVVTPIVVTLSQEKVRSFSTVLISQSVEEVMLTGDVRYEDLVDVKLNSANEIVMINTNSVEINRLVRQVTNLVQTRLDAINNTEIFIALGTFTGIPFLYGLGPDIAVQLIPVGSVNTRFSSNFTSAGINQTLHRLYFVISLTVGMVLPANTQNVVVDFEVQISESIIVGKIPEILLNGQKIS